MPIVLTPPHIDLGDIFHQTMYRKYRKRKECHGIAYLTNETGQTIQLFVQWGLLTGQHSRFASYLTNLRMVAHCYHTSRSTSLYNGRAAHQSICGIRGIFIKIQMVRTFPRNRLSRQIRFIHLQTFSLQQLGIGRYLVSGFQHDDISHHKFLTRNLTHLSVTYNPYKRLASQSIQHIEFTGGIVLKIKADACSQQYGTHDSDGFCKFIFHKSDYKRQQGGYQQYPYYGVLKFLQIKPPH